jgi:cobyric acid synthase
VQSQLEFGVVFKCWAIACHDPLRMESSLQQVAGLRLLRRRTTMTREKTTRMAHFRTPGGYSSSAYEIHQGETTYDLPNLESFAFLEDGARKGPRGDRILGTYLHGAFGDVAVSASLRT